MKAQKNEQPMLSEDGDVDLIGIIVSALRGRFGDAAATVARRQAELATSESAVQWSTVVSRLSA